MFRMLRFAAVMAASCSFMTAANAATIFNFNFSIPALFVGPATGSGQLFADQNANGTYKVTGAQGTTFAYSGAPARTINDADLVGVLGSPTISGNSLSGFTIDSLSLTGQAAYTFTPNIFGDKYSGIGAAGAYTNATLTLALGTQSATAVPEPASWAMMIAGFGMIGGAMRRRRTGLSLV